MTGCNIAKWSLGSALYGYAYTPTTWLLSGYWVYGFLTFNNSISLMTIMLNSIMNMFFLTIIVLFIVCICILSPKGCESVLAR